VVDNLKLPRDLTDQAKRLINAQIGLKQDNILIAATHTHSAVSAEAGTKTQPSGYSQPFNEYGITLIEGIVKSVKDAISNLEEAEIAWGVAKAPQHVFNRRWIMKEKVINPFGEYDQVLMSPSISNNNKKEPAGPTDPDVSFISVRALNGKRPISLLANYALHYIGGVQKNEVSADYFAVFANSIKELIEEKDSQHPPFVGIMSNGTSGDVAGTDRSKSGPSYQPYEKMQIVADDIAEKVYNVYQNLNYKKWVPIKVLTKEVQLQRREISLDLLNWANRIVNLPSGTIEAHAREKNFANRVIKLNKEPDVKSVIVQTFGIGDLGIGALPFEVFAETGLEIKQKSPFPTTFIMELANGAERYLPTPEQHELGGYEAWIGSNIVQKDATVILVDHIINQFQQIKQN